MNLLKMMTRKIEQEASKMEAQVRLPGLSVSIVDEEPKERLLITIFEILATLNYETKPDDEYLETIVG